MGLLELECSPSNSEVAGSNLNPGTSCWKVGGYLPMPGGLQCRNLDQLICTGSSIHKLPVAI